MGADRRAVLAGLAGLPFAAVPAVAVSTRALAGSADPFVAMHRQAATALDHLNAGVDDGADGDVTFDTLANLRERAFDMRATSLPGALASLEWARMEFAAFYIDPQAKGEEPDWLDRFTLNLLDGAINVLRQATMGEVYV